MRLHFVPLLMLLACSDPVDEANKSDTVTDAREFRCQQDMRTLWGEAERHFALKGEWPAQWSDVRQSALDPWGKEYILDTETNPPRLLSCGPDNVEGTVDDVLYMGQG